MMETTQAAKIDVSFCLGCIKPLAKSQSVLIGIPVSTPNQDYDYVCVDLCSSCIEAQEYNKIKKTLRYWLMESITVKLS